MTQKNINPLPAYPRPSAPIMPPPALKGNNMIELVETQLVSKELYENLLEAYSEALKLSYENRVLREKLAHVEGYMQSLVEEFKGQEKVHALVLTMIKFEISRIFKGEGV